MIRSPYPYDYRMPSRPTETAVNFPLPLSALFCGIRQEGLWPARNYEDPAMPCRFSQTALLTLCDERKRVQWVLAWHVRRGISEPAGRRGTSTAYRDVRKRPQP